jgi:hypothetical protein
MKMGNTCAMISNRVLLWFPLSAAAAAASTLLCRHGMLLRCSVKMVKRSSQPL